MIFFKMRGEKKEAATEEKITIDFAFASVVSIKEIKKGEKFTKEKLIGFILVILGLFLINYKPL